MKLHNKVYHQFCNISKEVENLVDEYVKNSKELQEILKYVELANNNIDILSESIKKANLYYEDKTLRKITFNKATLVSSQYPLTLWFKDSKGESNYTDFDFNTLIIILAEAGIIKDYEI